MKIRQTVFLLFCIKCIQDFGIIHFTPGSGMILIGDVYSPYADFGSKKIRILKKQEKLHIRFQGGAICCQKNGHPSFRVLSKSVAPAVWYMTCNIESYTPDFYPEMKRCCTPVGIPGNSNK